MDNLHLLVFLSVLGAATAGYCTTRYQSSFSCPRSYDSYNEIYCCGSSSNRYCCSYGHSGSGFWATRTIVGFIFVASAVIFFVVICSCCFCATCPLYRRRTQGRIISAPGTTMTAGTTVVYTNSSAAGMVQYPPYNNQYPPQPHPQGYGAPMPPSYAPPYPPPQYPATSPPPYPAAGQPVPGQQPPVPTQHQLYK